MRHAAHLEAEVQDAVPHVLHPAANLRDHRVRAAAEHPPLLNLALQRDFLALPYALQAALAVRRIVIVAALDHQLVGAPRWHQQVAVEVVSWPTERRLCGGICLGYMHRLVPEEQVARWLPAVGPGERPVAGELRAGNVCTRQGHAD